MESLLTALSVYTFNEAVKMLSWFVSCINNDIKFR